MKMIEINNINFRYNKNSKLVLENLSTCFDEGTINVLLGLNGSGKTTLIKILAGLLEGYDGDIHIDNNDIKALTIKQRSTLISYVSQKNNQIEDFLVREYLLFGKINKMKFYQSPTKDDEMIVEDFARKLEISYLLDKKMSEISGGERQIVSICCALIQDTKIIILDEPTSTLDIKNQYKVLSVLKELVKTENKTIILSSHNPNHALYLDSNVYLIKNSNIIDNGKAKEVITIDKLKTIYGDNVVYSKDLPYNEISFLNPLRNNKS